MKKLDDRKSARSLAESLPLVQAVKGACWRTQSLIAGLHSLIGGHRLLWGGILGLFLLGMAGCSIWRSSEEPLPAVQQPAAPEVVPTLEPAPSPTTKSTSPAPTEEPTPVPRPTTIAGLVEDAQGPVAGATVRIQLTKNETRTDPTGRFTLQTLTSSRPITLTAWAPGYYIGWTTARPGEEALVTLSLSPYYTTDNVAYDWFEEEGVEGSLACGLCHTAYPEWEADAHGQSAVNQRFLTMYQGTDVKGNKSPRPPTNSRGVPQPPDLTRPYFGPGFKLDFPNRAGNCSTCHTPLAAKQPNDKNCGWLGCHSSTTSEYATGTIDPGVSPLYLTGDAAEGISCELCHKTGDVYLNEETKLPFEDRPGILSMRLYRPEKGQDIFFGPLDDVVRPELPEARDSYLPLMKESAFCASCHHGVMGGVVGRMKVTGGVLIYSSYSEWLASPYSDPETGKTCQDCHMPTLNTNYFVFPERGGQKRDLSQIHSHRMPGAGDAEFLQNAVTLEAQARLEGAQLIVDVQVTNDKTGHHVPTDSPLRHVMLVVEARDGAGQPLALREGPILPEWAGNYAGQPGRFYAKVLRDQWTGEMPTGAYWRPVEIVEDTRLPALATDTSQYTFEPPTTPEATVDVRLVFRRAYQQLMQWKGWNDPDILMEQEQLTVKVDAP